MLKRALQSLIFRITGRLLIDPSRFAITPKQAQPKSIRPPPTAPRYGFLGDYPSFAAAAADCAGYDTQAIAQAVASQRQRSIDGAKIDTDERIIDVVAAFGVALKRLDYTVSVLDIGGANGFYSDVLAHFFPDVRFNWTIVETPSMAEACKDASHIRWVTSIPAEERFDVVLLSGTLQYLPTPYETLRQCGKIARWLILQRTPVGDREHFSRQVVPPEIFEGSFPHRSFNREELAAALGSIGTIEMAWTIQVERDAYVSMGALAKGFLVRNSEHKR